MILFAVKGSQEWVLLRSARGCRKFSRSERGDGS